MTLKGHNGREVYLIGFFGSEAIGKTSTGYSLTGRLRTHGLLAEFVSDSSAAMPFPPDRFDTHPEAWVYVIANKLARETEVALRTNVDTIVSDRTPLDLVAYAEMKHPDEALFKTLDSFILAWLHRYDRLYFFPAEGTAYRADEFREPTDYSRRRIDAHFLGLLPGLQRLYPNLVVASGSYRERAEFVYHDILAHRLGLTKAKRVVEQVRAWAASNFGAHLVEVRTLGSHSVTRAHIASDRDDFDLRVVLADEASDEFLDRARNTYIAARTNLESMCEATLDLAIVRRKELSHEV